MQRIFLVLIVALSIFFIGKYRTLKTNSLDRQKTWISLKRNNSLHFFGVPGVDDFMGDVQALAREELHLNAWFGFNDILYHEPLPEFETYSVHFQLAQDSYLWIFLDCNEESCWAYRASNYPEFPAGLYRINHNGKFLETKPQKLVETGVHVFRLIKDKDQYRIEIDNKAVTNIAYQQKDHPIRLSAGWNPVSVQWIKVKTANSEKVIDFSAPINWPFYGPLFFVALAGFFGLSFKFPKPAKIILSVVFFSSFLLMLSQKYYFSHRFPQELGSGRIEAEVLNSNYKIWMKYFENIRLLPQPIYHLESKQLIEMDGKVRFLDRVEPYLLEYPTPKNSIKIAFIGGSQTWGAGASESTNIWPSLVVKNLHQQSKKNIVALNFARCAGRLSDFLQRLPAIRKFHPDLLIVNFAANDSTTDDKVFADEFSEFTGALAAAGIKTLYSIEATNYEDGIDEPPKALFIRQHSLPIISLHDYINRPELRESGIIYVDQIHLTDYGQTRAAEFFLKQPEVMNLIGR